MNTVMLVGRLAQDIEVKTTETGKEVTKVSLAVNRSFKNPDGIYEVDFIDCVLWDGLAKNIDEYCKKGDTVGIRGRIQVSHYEVEGVKKKSVDVIVERMSFLGSSRENFEEKQEKKNKKSKKGEQ